MKCKWADSRVENSSNKTTVLLNKVALGINLGLPLYCPPIELHLLFSVEFKVFVRGDQLWILAHVVGHLLVLVYLGYKENLVHVLRIKNALGPFLKKIWVNHLSFD